MCFLIILFLCVDSGVTLVLRDYRNNSQIIFPEEVNRSQINQEIPLDLIRQLNEVSSVEEFYENFLEPYRPNHRGSGSFNFEARLGWDEEETNGVKTAKMAKCMPELRTVPLKSDRTTATFYYPSCTRVNRCGGCCSHHLLSCQPVETEILQMSVVVADYRGGNQLQYRGREVIQVEQHVKCKCDCKIREKDCTRFQRHNREKCQCECINTDEERKCYEEGRGKKLWNKDNCSCMCREELECSFGFYFDPFRCRCVSYPKSRKKQKPSTGLLLF